MKKSIELRKEYEELKNSIAALKSENKIEEAHAKLAGLKDLENKIREAEIEETMNAGAGGKKEVKNKETMNVNRLFNRLITGKSLNAEEMEFLNKAGTPGQVEATDSKGGYLVATEQFNRIKELRRNLVSLKPLCNVVPVTSFKGNMPIETETTGELIAFEELNEINKGDIDFAQISWNVADYGDIIPISKSLLADEDVDLISYVGRRFTKKAVNTENKKILTLLKGLSGTEAADYTSIVTALNVTLDPAVSNNAVIITNQTGFDYLDKLVGTDKRPLLEINLQNTTQKKFKGRDIIVLSDAVLEMEEVTKAPVFVGDMSEFISFFDRQGLELATSDEAGFTKNVSYIRAIERFDVKKVDSKAMVYLKLATA